MRLVLEKYNAYYYSWRFLKKFPEFLFRYAVFLDRLLSRLLNLSKIATSLNSVKYFWFYCIRVVMGEIICRYFPTIICTVMSTGLSRYTVMFIITGFRCVLECLLFVLSINLLFVQPKMIQKIKT